jgi:hypothetical protein
MTTYGQLVQQVRQQLLGYALNQESMAELASSRPTARPSTTSAGGWWRSMTS